MPSSLAAISERIDPAGIRRLPDTSRRAYAAVRKAVIAFSVSELISERIGPMRDAERLGYEALQLVELDHAAGVMQPPLPPSIAEHVDPLLDYADYYGGNHLEGATHSLSQVLLNEIFEHGYRSDGVGERG